MVKKIKKLNKSVKKSSVSQKTVKPSLRRPKIVKKSKAKCNHTDDTPATKLNPFLT